MVELEVTQLQGETTPAVTLTWSNRFDPSEYRLAYNATELTGLAAMLSNTTLSTVDSNFTITDLLFYTVYDFQVVAVYDTLESDPVSVTHTTEQGGRFSTFTMSEWGRECANLLM